MDPELHIFLYKLQKQDRDYLFNNSSAMLCAQAFLGLLNTAVPYDVRKQHMKVLAWVNEHKLSNRHP